MGISDLGFNSETKGSGYTSPSDDIPEGDSFDVDYVAHELGHQLGEKVGILHRGQQ
jgi:hypothetical protein